MYPPGELRKRLRGALDADSVFTPMEGAVPSAVLVPVIAGGEDVRLVFTQRTHTLSRHAGEISFPGGLADPGESPLDTALRETEEELGVPADEIEVLGGLPPVHTRVTGMLISPVVGLFEREPRFTPNAAEIASVLILPLRELASIGREDSIEWEGRSYQTSVFETGGHTIWGATARILQTFLDALESPDAPAEGRR
jgi:8-oxo-dGTP pyrophosphatase MutT (NUDIX family)